MATNHETAENFNMTLTEEEVLTLSIRLPWIIDKSDEFGAPEINLLTNMAAVYCEKHKESTHQAFDLVRSICGCFTELAKGYSDFSTIASKADELSKSI